MGNIFTDIATAVKVTSEVRKARKAGTDAVQIKPVCIMKCVDFTPAFLNTMERGQRLEPGKRTLSARERGFENRPYETRRRMEYTPENPGEWVERARFWQQQLRPVLPPKMYHTVMVKFISWYIHCLRRRKGTTV